MAVTAGSRVAERFFVEKIEERATKTGKKFFTLQLRGEDAAYPAKVWSNAIPQVQVKAGVVAYVEGAASEYQGKLEITIDSAYTLHDEDPSQFLQQAHTTPTLVFDIETAGLSFDELDPDSQAYLIKREGGEDQDIEAIKTKTALYPLFGWVAAVGLLDTRGKGTVLLVHDKTVELDNSLYTCEAFPNEKALLTRFWEIAEKYERFVTFNGNGFDWPYMVFRSGVNRVKVPFQLSLAFNRDEKFFDLAIEIPPGRNTYSLEETCKAFGLTNPKAAGVHGGDVGALIAAGRQQDVANYVSRDVSSTKELFDLWRTYLSGRTVL